MAIQKRISFLYYFSSVLWYWYETISSKIYRTLFYKRYTIRTEDLLVKYHGDTALVDDLIKSKVAAMQYRNHPEFPEREDPQLK